MQDAIDQTFDNSLERENWTPKERMEREEFFFFNLHPEEHVSKKPDVNSMVFKSHKKEIGKQRDKRRFVTPA